MGNDYIICIYIGCTKEDTFEGQRFTLQLGKPDAAVYKRPVWRPLSLRHPRYGILLQGDKKFPQYDDWENIHYPGGRVASKLINQTPKNTTPFRTWPQAV
ncbi:MAG: hypothetical protein ACOCXH_16530 [Cyclobacteriaceae bacterium]